MIQHHANTVRAIAHAATAHRVTLPADLGEQAAHLADLESEQRQAPNPAQVAADLTRHLGDRAAMKKATSKAATDLAAAEAAAKIRGALADRCALALWQRMRQHREAIAEAFAPAVAEHLLTLTADAPRLPVAFAPEQADQLDADTFAAWTRARDAHAALSSLNLALSPLYSVQATDLITKPAEAALRYTAPPTFTDPGHAHRFARALAGTRHGGSDLGAVNISGVFAPTACAELGATFEWAGPAEVQQRANAVVAGATPPVVERPSNGRAARLLV